MHKVFSWTKQNNLILNPDKTTFTLFTPDPIEYKSNMDLKNKQHCTTIGNAPKGSGPYLRSKLTYCTHIHNISVQAHNPLQMIKALRATGWSKQKETLMATYKAVMRPAVEYANFIWSPLALTNCKSCSIENSHRIHTRHKHTTAAMTKHSYFQCTSTYSSTRHNKNRKHNIHHTPYTNNTTYFNTPRLKPTIFNNGRYTTNILTDPHTVPTTGIKQTYAIYIHLLYLDIYPQEAIIKYCAHLHHTLVALKRYLFSSLVTPLPNSEQIKHPSSKHTYTKVDVITSTITIPAM